MKLKEQIEALNCEAERHRELAKEIGLDLIQQPDHPDAAKLKHKALMFLAKAEAYKTATKIVSGTFKLSVLLFALILTGCTAPQSSTSCTLLKFPQTPAPALVEQLAATQPGTTPAEVSAWFAKGERGFVLASSHTNEIAAAVASGATASTIHQISPAMLPTTWGHR